MSDDRKPIPRKTRADGQRNREMILAAANRVLSEKGTAASMEEIAVAAGVGNGTLYRHFPTRTALIQAVCRDDTKDLVNAAKTLAETHAPPEALTAWMDIYVNYAAGKQIIAEATSALVSPSTDLAGSSAADVREALAMLFARVQNDGQAEAALDPLDLLRAVAGVASIGPSPDWAQSARRLVRILVKGLARS